jgi:hypothetical protein
LFPDNGKKKTPAKGTEKDSAEQDVPLSQKLKDYFSTFQTFEHRDKDKLPIVRYYNKVRSCAS